MRRLKSHSSLVIGILAAGLLAGAAVASADEPPNVSAIYLPVMEAQPKDWINVQPTPASTADLTIGDGYTMDVVRAGATRSYTGALVQATGRWVVLRTLVVERQLTGSPYLAGLPLLGGAFRRAVQAQLETDVWIPRDAATFRAHLKVPGGVKTAAAGESPPLNGDCFVDMVSEGKIFHTYARLTSVRAKEVTLVLFEDPKQPQRDLGCEFLMCLSIPRASHPLPAQASSGNTTKR